MTTMPLRFDNSFARLPTLFYTHQAPTPFQHPHLVSFNADVAELLGLPPQWETQKESLHYLSAQSLFLGCNPLAMKYTGHQFGAYNPDLGDGRGLLFGEVINANNERWDLHLKGAGTTPYSRFADGRAVLRSCIREYLASEALHGLGIKTTRALCIIGSDEAVRREKTETGAMLWRVADSHIRFGHFEWLFHSGQHTALKQLADYVIQRHYPSAAHSPHPYLHFFERVIEQTALMITQWQLYGFAHGVMNTDNFSITGATFDFGPYGFMDRYEPGFICNHSDYAGRYAWNQQPNIGLWNLNALAHALSGLIDRDALIEALHRYEPTVLEHYASGLRKKLGFTQARPEDRELGMGFLDLLMKNQMDYTESFRDLSQLSLSDTKPAIRDKFIDREAFDAWLERYQARLAAENSQDSARQTLMKSANPKYILRNYLAQLAIEEAEQGRFDQIETLRLLLKNPFDEQPEHSALSAPPPDWGRHLEISCSS